MMKKTLLIPIFVILLAASVSGFYDGQILSQTDIDRINVDSITNVSIDCRKESLRINAPTFVYSCQTIEQTGDTQYVVVRETHQKQFMASTVYQYLNRESLQRIKDLTRHFIGVDVDNTVEETKNVIRGYQTSRTIRAYKLWIYTYDPFV